MRSKSTKNKCVSNEKAYHYSEKFNNNINTEKLS